MRMKKERSVRRSLTSKKLRLYRRDSQRKLTGKCCELNAVELKNPSFSNLTCQLFLSIKLLLQTVNERAAVRWKENESWPMAVSFCLAPSFLFLCSLFKIMLFGARKRIIFFRRLSLISYNKPRSAKHDSAIISFSLGFIECWAQSPSLKRCRFSSLTLLFSFKFSTLQH